MSFVKRSILFSPSNVRCFLFNTISCILHHLVNERDFLVFNLYLENEFLITLSLVKDEQWKVQPYQLLSYLTFFKSKESVFKNISRSVLIILNSFWEIWNVKCGALLSLDVEQLLTLPQKQPSADFFFFCSV